MTLTVRGVAWSAFGVAVALLIACSVFVFRAANRLSSSEAAVGHTREVETLLEDIAGEVFRASNAAQNFVLTGDKELLAGYGTAVARIPGDLEQLRVLTSENPRLDSLQADIQSELSLIAGFIQSHRKGTSSIDADAQMARTTAEIQDHIEAELQKIREEQTQLLSARQAASRENYRHTLILIAVSLLIALALLAAQMLLLNYSYSQYRKTEYGARQSREIVNAFFSSSTVGFGILDSQLRYTRVNDVLPRMAALEPEDLLGKSVPEVFGLRGSRTETVLRDVLRTGAPLLDREISAELPRKPGQVRHWLVNYFPIPGEGGGLTQIGVIAVDVTARRNAEEALRKLSGRLLGIQDQERRRIARELHDSLGQYLAGLKIAIDLLGNSPSSEKNKELLAECRDILEKSITETRTLSHLLHPPLLDEAGFSSAASWFVSGFSQRSGIPVSLDLPPDMPRLSEAVEIALFRVLQESLTNVHRHSQAASAEIKVENDAEQITIEVMDHGHGMPDRVLQQLNGDGIKLGVGLAGMRERVHELGGNFEVTSDHGGTVIRASVPLAGREESPTAQAEAAS
ncbi:MAG TPA: PAS domain-containing protein [Terriglobales bacterium]|jgi:PAS domain S-box-containing protein|nr:PAS domain-containing protein [Terriglobales bacterium]